MSIVKSVIDFFRRPAPLPVVRRSSSPVNFRMYAAAKSSRLTQGFGSSGQNSADTELVSSLRPLRARSREVVRDAGYAKRAKILVVDNVVGQGIGMQAQVKTTRGDLNQRVNADVEDVWEEWCAAKNCHTGGVLHFHDIERFIMGQWFEGGEIFIRKHRRRFGSSLVPLALEVIEPERVLDEFQPSPVDPRAKVRLGVEMDNYHRPIAYWIRTLHPGEVRMSAWEVDKIERVPADQIIHIHFTERWPQTRGVPWLHTALRKLYDMDGYTEAEIIRARSQANTIGGLKTGRDYGDEVKDEAGNVTRREITSEAGTYEVLYENEELQFPPASAPNSTADPFLRFLLREFSAGVGPSYGSISRDRSQTNYSSERQDIIEDRDFYRIIQMALIRQFRQDIHQEFVQAGVLSRAIASIAVESYALDPRWYLKVRYKPRGWSWVDPTTEEEAYRGGVKDGFTTLTDVIAKTADGRDIEDILEERAQELVLKKQIEEKYDVKLDFDTDPAQAAAEIESKKQPPAPKDNGEDIKKITDKQEQMDKDNADRFGKLVAEGRKRESVIIQAIQRQQIAFNFNPTTNIAPAPVTVPVDARSTVNVPEMRNEITVQPAAPAQVTVPIENRVDVQPAAPAQVTVPIENRVDVQPAAPAQVTVPIENRVDVQPAAPAQVTVPIENRVDVQPAAPAQVMVPIENRVDVQPAAPAQVTVPIENKNDITVPERELHFHQEKKKGKRTIKLKDKDGKVVRTAELEE